MTDYLLNFTSTKQKRIELIENYFKSSKILFQEENVEQYFEKYALELNYPGFDDDPKLVEVLIRYSIFLLEEFDYEKKINGLKLLNHLLENLTPSLLQLNMRSDLIYNSYNKYLNDKDSIDFLDIMIKSMRELLNIIETKYSSSVHYYKKHSLVVDSMLSNCYLSSNTSAKIVYYKHFILFIKQMSIYSSRHLDKYLTIAFDFVENSKFSFDFEKQIDLIENSLDLVFCLVEICKPRIHSHAKRIMNYSVKLIYFYSLYLEKYSTTDYVTIDLIEKCFKIIKSLKDRISVNVIQDLKHLNEDKSLNKHFLKLLENI